MSRRREAAELALALTLSTRPLPLAASQGQAQSLPIVGGTQIQISSHKSTPRLFQDLSSLTPPTTTQDSRELELRPCQPGKISSSSERSSTLAKMSVSVSTPIPTLMMGSTEPKNGVLFDSSAGGRSIASGTGGLSDPSPIQSFTPHLPPSISSSHLIPSSNLINGSRTPATLPRSSPIGQFPLSHLSSTETSRSERPLFSPTEVSISRNMNPSPIIVDRIGQRNAMMDPEIAGPSRTVVTYGRRGSNAQTRSVSPVKQTALTPTRSVPNRPGVILSPDTEDEAPVIIRPSKRKTIEAMTSDSEAEELIEEIETQPSEFLAVAFPSVLSAAAEEVPPSKKRRSTMEVLLPTSKSKSSSKDGEDGHDGSRVTKDSAVDSPDPLDLIPRNRTYQDRSSPSRLSHFPPRKQPFLTNSTIPSSAGIRNRSHDIPTRNLSNAAPKNQAAEFGKSETPTPGKGIPSTSSTSVGRKSARQAKAESERLERERKEAEEKAERRRKRALEKEKENLRLAAVSQPTSQGRNGRRRSDTSSSLKSSTAHLADSPASESAVVSNAEVITIEASLPPRAVSSAKSVNADEHKSRVQEIVVDEEVIVFDDPDSIEDHDFVKQPRGRTGKGKGKAVKAKGKAKEIKSKGKAVREAVEPSNDDGDVTAARAAEEVDKTQKGRDDNRPSGDHVQGELSALGKRTASGIAAMVVDVERTRDGKSKRKGDQEENDDEEEERALEVGKVDIDSKAAMSLSTKDAPVPNPARLPLEDSTPNANLAPKRYSSTLFKIPISNGSPSVPLTKPKQYNWKAPRNDLQQVLQKFPGAKTTGMSRRVRIAPLHSKIGPPAKSLPPLPVKPVKRKKGDSDDDEDDEEEELEEEEEEEFDEDGNVIKRVKVKGPKVRGMEWYMVED